MHGKWEHYTLFLKLQQTHTAKSKSPRGEIKKKQKNIAFLTDSMMKTFCMGEFNKVLKKGTAYLP